MTEDLRVYVAVAVEGESDTGMVQALLRHVHLTLSRPCLVKKVPGSPDELPHAKRELLRLCASSRSHHVRDSMVRIDGAPGPLYVSCLNEFARERWNVVEAQERSPSLRRTVARLESVRRRLLTVSAGG